MASTIALRIAAVWPSGLATVSQMTEPEVQVRFPCENCGGTGLVDPDPIPGGLVIQNSKLTCRRCDRGVAKAEWLPISEFRERYLGTR